MTMKLTPSEPKRIGEILVAHGLLTNEQVTEILQQQQRGGRPFGDLAERMFGVDAEQVEKAWAEQYVSLGTEVDLSEQTIAPETLRIINRRQAWQFRVLPMSRREGELVVATSRENLRRAVNFAWQRFDEPVFFMIAPAAQLEQFLMHHYPWPAVLDLPAAG